MPELPEVEMVKNAVAPSLTGRTVTGVSLPDPRVCADPSPEDFARALTGRTFCAAGRRGKFLRFFLVGGGELVIHLRMTGVLLACPRDFPDEPHTRAVLDLSDGRQLRFADRRRFGRVWLLAAGEAEEFAPFARLGPEPFDPCLTAAWLKERFGASRRAVKACLLDQSLVAGIGNIYSDEILFAARLHPLRPACSLTAAELRRLAEQIRAVIEFHVGHIAAGADEYLRTRGKEYRNTPYLRVYGHAGKPCPVCGTVMEKTSAGGRTSVFCPRCQKPPKPRA